MLLDLFLFIIVVFAVFYIPGRYLLRKLLWDHSDFSIIVGFSLALGISIFLLVNYLLSWVGVVTLYQLLVLCCLFLELPQTLLELRSKYRNTNLFTIDFFLISIGALAMIYLTWRSGSIHKDGMYFYGVNATDAIYHLSLIGNLIHHFPPNHPGLAGVPLRGYNLFYDFLVALFAKLYFFNPFDLFFRYFTAFTAFFYGFSGYALGRFLKLAKLTRYIFLYLLYFAQSFIFILPYLFRTNTANATYGAGIVQPLSQIVDPSVLFSVSILFVFYIALFSMHKNLHFIVPALLLSILPNLKIYTAVLAFGALGVISFITISQRKHIAYFLVFSLAGLISAVTYLPINYGAGHLLFAPFLFFRHFMESSSIFSPFNWALQYLVYVEHNNWLKILYLYAIALLLYFVPTLGIRLVTIGLLPKLRARNFYTLGNIFWMSFISFAFIIPLLFVQSVAVFVIVQFLWVAYIILLLPTAVIIGNFTREKKWTLQLFIFIFLVLLSLPETINILSAYSKDPLIVNNELVVISHAIQKVVPKTESTLVINRQDDHDIYSIPLVSALSENGVYYEPEGLEFLHTEDIIRERKKDIDYIANALKFDCNDPGGFARKIIPVVAKTSAHYLLSVYNSNCFDKLTYFEKIVSSGQYTLFKINP